MNSYEKFSIFPVNENDVEAVTKNVDTIVTSSVNSALQQATFTQFQTQKLTGTCSPKQITAFENAITKCHTDAIGAGWPESEVKDLCNTDFCSYSDISQSQVINTNLIGQMIAGQRNKIANSIKSDLHNKIAGIPGGGCGIGSAIWGFLTRTGCKSVTKNEIDNTSSETTKVVNSLKQKDFNSVSQAQVVTGGGVNMHNITQKEAATVILQKLQKNDQYNTAVNKIATKIASNIQAKKSGIAMLIIIIVLVILLIVVGYFFYKWWKKRKASGGFSRRSTRSLAKNLAKR